MALPSAEKECAEKLGAIGSYLKGDQFEKNVSLLNLMLKRAANLWLMLEPTTGTVIQGSILASDLLDDMLGRLSAASQDDINRVFHEVLSTHEERMSATARRVSLLTPRVGLVLDMTGHWNMKGAHGVACLRVTSRNDIGVVFIEPILNPELYIAHCNVAGTYLDVTSHEVKLVLPSNFDPSSGLVKVILQRITDF